jgi:serine/threonine-protein kinase HipA
MAKKDALDLEVVADWGKIPFTLGELAVYSSGPRDIFSFAFDPEALAHPGLRGISLDPDLRPDAGRQYPRSEAANFGIFLDGSPDRWGRLLMDRQLDRMKRRGEVNPSFRLRERDYFLGVHDEFRTGAIRVRLKGSQEFLATSAGISAPPMVRLRKLEQAARALEQGAESDRVDEWLRILIAPGGSLGGARPKASVADVDGRLWIAKFPSAQDKGIDVGAWEMVLQVLARASRIDVPEARADRSYSEHHTYLVRRFDRTPGGSRIHFASAMTLTGHLDGEDHSTGASYLELARVIATNGAQPQEDLAQLWRRIVFNICVSNTDDHLRNHGFLLEPGRGWRLAPAFDMNPSPEGKGLKLNINSVDNAQELDLALSVAPQFRVGKEQSQRIIKEVTSAVAQWPRIADALGISRAEQQKMAAAFAHAQFQRNKRPHDHRGTH